jgi:hypothetical protein
MSMRQPRHQLDRLEGLVGPPATDPQPPRTFRDFAADFLHASKGERLVPLRPVSALQELLAQRLTRDVLNAGGPETNVVVPGTALHRECIVCRPQQTPGWETHLFRSCTAKLCSAWRFTSP